MTQSAALPEDGSRPTTDVLSLVTQPSGWRRVKLYGSAASAPHVRRRVDTITLILHGLALLVVVPTARTVDGLESALADAVASLPSVITQVSAVFYDLLAVWAVVMVLLAAVRRHWRLAASLLTTVPVAVAITFLLNQALGLDGPTRALASGTIEGGVPLRFILAVALALVVARELSRPFRTTTHRLAVAAAIGATLLPVASPYRVVCAVLAASVAAGVVRLAFGTARSVTSATDIQLGLRDLGVETVPIDRWPSPRDTVTSAGSRLRVRAVGRDDWDDQLMVTAWRFLWYRNSGSRLRRSPRLKLEHQALLLLMAQERGVGVTPVAAVGTSRVGDALLATNVDGAPLTAQEPDGVSDDRLARMWVELEALHAAGIAHGGLDPSAILVDDAGAVRFGSFDRAEPVTRLTQVHADRAQLLVSTAIAVGSDRAIDAAKNALGDDEEACTGLVAHLQAAALDHELRRALDAAGLSLDDLRTDMAAAAGIEVPELQRIWRVTWGSLFRLLLIVLVASTLIGQLADIGWDTIVDALRSASLPVLLAALMLGQAPRVAQGGSLQAASPAPVPLVRVTKLVFATCFINLAVPSTAARVATSIRFFQRSGTTAAGAVSASAVDSMFGFVAQLSLLFGLLLLGLGTLGFGGESTFEVDASTVSLVITIVVLAVVVAAIAVAAIDSLRQRVLGVLHQLKDALDVLHSPATVVRLLLCNLAAELLFSLTMWTVLRAFGQPVDLVDVVIINETVALFAGFMPVPGGVGVTEAALTAGFVAVGVPEQIAFSAALCYRLCTFYLPPTWGYVFMSSLQRDGYL